MPVHRCRRSFTRGGLAMVLAAWASACGQSNSTLDPTPSGATPLAPTEPLNPYPQPDVAVTTAPYPAPAVESSYPAPGATQPVPTTAAPTAAGANTSPVPNQALFSGAQAFEHASAQMQWIPRDTGSEGWVQCGDYIAAQFEQYGWTVENQRFEYQGVNCRNIIAKRGSGPGVIIGAHYDARRRADRDPDLAKQSDPVPAANDGASGVAVLLELARVLKPEELGREIWLTAFDAEDNGDLDGWDYIAGSTYMANNLTITPEAVIVVDMVGDASQQLYFEQTSDQPIRAGVWQVANELGYASFVPEPKFSVIDDHTPFLQRGLRAIDIIDFEYPYWHTTQDTIDKISPESLESVGRTLETWLARGGPGIA